MVSYMDGGILRNNQVIGEATFITVTELRLKLERAEAELQEKSALSSQLQSSLGTERLRSGQLSGLLQDMVTLLRTLYL